MITVRTDPLSLIYTLTRMHCDILTCVPDHDQFIHHFIDYTGLAVELDPIEQNMMDSGSWHWEYSIKGTHIQLEMVEL